MTITIDASRSLAPQPTGIERYAREIIFHLLRHPRAKDHRWLLLAPHYPSQNHPLADLPSFAHWKIIPGQRFWTLWHVSRAFWQEPILRESILFVPAHTLPLITPVQTILTVHDLAFRLFPEAYGGQVRGINHELYRSARKANAIITPSETTKTDLRHFYRLPPEKITTIYHGIDQRLNSLPTTDTNPNPLQSAPYFLYIGRIEHRKNILRIVEAFQQLVTQDKRSEQLILIGKPGYGHEVIERHLSRLPKTIQNRIHQLPYQSDEMIGNYLRQAAGFIFPSLYEGFGFPILEAMAANIPVLTSATSALGEISGDAAITVNPEQTASLLAGWRQLTDPTIIKSLIVKGAARVKEFTWKQAAAKTMAVLTKTHS